MSYCSQQHCPASVPEPSATGFPPMWGACALLLWLGWDFSGYSLCVGLAPMHLAERPGPKCCMPSVICGWLLVWAPLQGDTSAGQGHLPGLALLPVKCICLDWWSKELLWMVSPANWRWLLIGRELLWRGTGFIMSTGELTSVGCCSMARVISEKKKKKVWATK